MSERQQYQRMLADRCKKWKEEQSSESLVWLYYNYVADGLTYEQMVHDLGLPTPRPFRLWRGGGQADLDQSDIVHAPNGGIAHIYIRGIDPSGPTNSWKFAPSAANVDSLASQLWAENKIGGRYSNFRNALAPLSTIGGNVVGLLVKYSNLPNPTFNAQYQLYDRNAPPGPAPVGIPLATDFSPDGAAGNLSWVDAVSRLDQDLNDRAAGRSGDLVMLMNTQIGAIAVHEADILKGWHGAATQTESEVPMRWHYSGSKGKDANHRSDLLDLVADQLNATKAGDAGSGGRLRTRHFKAAILNLLNALPANVVNIP